MCVIVKEFCPFMALKCIIIKDDLNYLKNHKDREKFEFLLKSFIFPVIYFIKKKSGLRFSG